MPMSALRFLSREGRAPLAKAQSLGGGRISKQSQKKKLSVVLLSAGSPRDA